MMSLSTAKAQEKSVRPGINDPFQNPDVKKFEDTFEGESREVFAKRKQIVAAVGVKPGESGAGPNIGNIVWGYRGSDILAAGSDAPFFDFEAFPGDTVGVWVG